MAEKKNYLPIIWQSILVGSFLIGIGMGWAQINGRVKAVETAHQVHCLNSKDKFEKVPDIKLVEMQFDHIKDTLEDIQRELLGCRGADSELQKTLQAILVKLK